MVDWPNHKISCGINAEMLSSLKAESVRIAEAVRNGALPESTLDPLRIHTDLTRWRYIHREELYWAAVQALNLRKEPLNCSNFVVKIMLAPSGLPYPHQFVVESTEVEPIESVRATLKVSLPLCEYHKAVDSCCVGACRRRPSDLIVNLDTNRRNPDTH